MTLTPAGQRLIQTGYSWQAVVPIIVSKYSISVYRNYRFVIQNLDDLWLNKFGILFVYLEQLLAMLWPSWGYLWGLAGYLGPPWGCHGLCWGYCLVILRLLWASSSTYSSNIESAYLVEMLNSCSLGPCRARMQRPKTTMSSSIAFTHFIGILKSILLDPWRAKTHQP